MHKPSYTITPNIINYIAKISGYIEHFNFNVKNKDKPYLRKVNKIKKIYSSLAIKGNNLSENNVKDIIDGKIIVAPVKQIQEVKNANIVYNLIYHTLNPFSITDLLRAHKNMMDCLCNNPGSFRKKDVKIFSDNESIYIGSPADKIPYLIEELFDWLIKSDEHLLIKSCVFNYEFEYIHPFSDGNGRMGRLWQSLILGLSSEVFEYLPLENLVFKDKQAYYDSINCSIHQNDCQCFIEFMLNKILNAFQEYDLNNVYVFSDDYFPYISDNVDHSISDDKDDDILDDTIDEISNDVVDDISDDKDDDISDNVVDDISDDVVDDISDNVHYGTFYNLPNDISDDLLYDLIYKVINKNLDLSKSTLSVLKEILINPHQTAKKIGNNIGITDRSVRKHIAILRNKNIISRVGANKNGFWKVNKQ